MLPNKNNALATDTTPLAGQMAVEDYGEAAGTQIAPQQGRAYMRAALDVVIDLAAENGLKYRRGDFAIYGGVSLVIGYTSPGRHLPNIFGEETGEPYYYVPEGAEYTVLYEAGDGYLIAEKPLDAKYHDYTKYW